MRIANADFVTGFIDQLTTQPDDTAALDAWVAGVLEIELRTWAAPIDSSDDTLAASLQFALGTMHRLTGAFDLARGVVVVK